MRSFGFLCLLGAWSSTLASAETEAAPSPELAPFTVRHSVEMAYFGDGLFWSPNLDAEAGYSPDGRHYAVLTHQADVTQGDTESTLWLFDTVAVAASLSGARRASPLGRRLTSVRGAVNGAMSEKSGGNAIAKARWSPDGQRIAFSAVRGGESRALFEAAIDTGKVRIVTDEPSDIVDFQYAGRELFFYARNNADELDSWRAEGGGLPDRVEGAGESLVELLFPHWPATYMGDSPVHIGRVDPDSGQSRVVASGVAPIDIPQSHVFAVSPDSRFTLAIRRAQGAHPEWRQLEPRYETFRPRIEKGAISDFGQYILIDNSNGRIQPAVKGPLGGWLRYPGVQTAAWAPDSGHVALSNTYLLSDEHPELRRRPCAVAVLALQSSQVSCVRLYAAHDPSALVKLSFVAADTLELTYLKDRSSRAIAQEWYRLDGVHWSRIARKRSADSAAKLPRFSVAESLNEPPVLVATSADGKLKRVVLNPNPQLQEVELGRASVYRWRDPLGREISGGLMLPPSERPGHRYPLVIQTHGFNPHRFLNTGGLPNGQGARALAARGIAVLQVQEPATFGGTPRELVDDGMNVYIAAIDRLVTEGVVDPARVGIAGISRTGLYVMTALTRAPERFRAAAMSEADCGDFPRYLLNVDYLEVGRPHSYARVFGTAPFGEGLAKWIERAPGFNTDKIHAPVLFGFSDPWSLIYGWSCYAALRVQERPADMLYLRSGRHGLQKALHRFWAQELHVDWFDFWLNGDAARVSNSDREMRWIRLRDQRQTLPPQP